MTSTPTRLIAHLDMDAFFASVELLRYPELRGRPVMVGGRSRHQPQEVVDAVTGAVTRHFATLRGYDGRGVITTATYEARELGLGSAMSMRRAAAIAPDTILLPADFDAYRRHSRAFKAAVRAICPAIEDRGIDEIYVDLTEPVLGSSTEPGTGHAHAPPANPPADAWRRATALARTIKAAVREATGLSCSIAVAPNKLLAKIASDLDKPDGLTIVTADDVPRRIWPLPARRVNGIGPKANARLEAMGIRTIGDLARADPTALAASFGANFGGWLHRVAHGQDDRPVVTHSEPKSISRETTFERDLHARHDRAELSGIFTSLCERVADDLRRKGYAGRTIGLKLRFADFRTVTRDLTIAVPTQDPREIRLAAGQCLKRVTLERRIRLLGVRVGGLVVRGREAAPAQAPARVPGGVPSHARGLGARPPFPAREPPPAGATLSLFD